FPPQRLTDISLDFAREWKLGAAAGEPRDRAFQYVRARIADAIDAMAKAHQPFAAFERAVDPRLYARAAADGVEHFQHRLRRAAVQRSRERAISRGHRGKQVGLR